MSEALNLSSSSFRHNLDRLYVECPNNTHEFLGGSFSARKAETDEAQAGAMLRLRVFKESSSKPTNLAVCHAALPDRKHLCGCCSGCEACHSGLLRERRTWSGTFLAAASTSHVRSFCLHRAKLARVERHIYHICVSYIIYHFEPQLYLQHLQGPSRPSCHMSFLLNQLSERSRDSKGFMPQDLTSLAALAAAGFAAPLFILLACYVAIGLLIGLAECAGPRSIRKCSCCR